MKTYSKTNLRREEDICNYKPSQTQRRVEYALEKCSQTEVAQKEN
jgi:hypothetical protein